ncbi:MAG: phospho-sugar mutase [Clostridia bacterium]|nr:phospho-sugar mutase [Clostridia bacterium]
MNDVQALYAQWLEGTASDPALHAELTAIADNEEEILDRFYQNLEFGTAGLRGVLGAGTNRMNLYTVGQATQGLADYLNGQQPGGSVAIGYDSRIGSEEFARLSAEILAANGIKVYLYRALMPTPFVSFAVMRLGCSSGIVITASHNPSQYNGYKCYDPAGYQMTEEAAAATYACIAKVEMFGGVKRVPFDEALADGRIAYISDELIEAFYAEVLTRPIHPEVVAASDLRIIYTPLNGTGNVPVRTVLDRAGFKQVRVVPEQEKPDGNFPTCPYPNPEIRQVFECGLAMAEKAPADLLLATDPDCDRVGIAVRTDAGYELLSGNDVGVLLCSYILSQRQALGTLPEKPIIVKSFVSTPLANKVCAKYGCEMIEVPTGFKYIGEIITNLEKQGEKDRFILGFEESYGYLIGDHARDKDAVAASLMICEMAAYYKAQGQTLAQVLDALYAEFGAYSNKLYNFTFAGASGMAKMADIMNTTRANPPQTVAGSPVAEVYDYANEIVTDTATGATRPTGMIKTNVLKFAMADGNFAIVRPSGTEPKIKFYVTGIGADRAAAAAAAEAIGADLRKSLGVE